MTTESSDVLSAGQDLWTAVAELLRPQGRRGEMLAEPLTNLPEIFRKGRSFQLRRKASSQGAAAETVLEDCWKPQGRNAGRLVVKLSGVESISAAEVLNGSTLLIKNEEIPPLEAGTFFVKDLLGCKLMDGENLLGVIVDLQFPISSDGQSRIPDAADLLVVEPSGMEGTETVLVPFVEAWLLSVDPGAKVIRMKLPEGLLD